LINLLRNREVRVYFSALAGFGLAGAVLCFLSGGLLPGFFAAAAAAVILTSSILFTRSRYRDIARLSDCLSRIAAGDYSMDLREYGEGELSILYDELHKVTRTLSHQAERLERDKQWLADTLADISHQLKTPLTSVTMMTDLLDDPKLPPEKREEFLNGIRAGTERIRWLVLSLLKLSRLDADAVVFRQEPVDVGNLVELAIESLRIPMELKEQQFVPELEAAAITGDLTWLAEAVGNLLKNSMEHTPTGGRIGICCKDNPLYTMLEVWDDGPGIPKEDINRVFERFFRGKNAAPDSVGIGLALSKSIINHHGGMIEACAEPTEAVRFRLKLYKTAV